MRINNDKLKTMTISPELSGKTRPRQTALAGAMILFFVSLLGSCHALNRGDVLQQADDALYFSKIGFLADDNLANGLPRDTIVNVQGHGDIVAVNVPYVTDTTLDMNVYFETVGKETTVEYEDTPGVFVEIQSGANAISFNDGSNPLDVRFRISKTDAFSDDPNPETQEIVVRVTKTITPVLVGKPGPNDPAPLDPRISFVDEGGNTLTTMPASFVDATRYHWNDERFQITVGPTYNAAFPPEPGFEIEVMPFYPGRHHLFVDTGFFADPDGYTNSARELDFIYDPPAVHLSQSGNDAYDGLTPQTAVKTWAAARAILANPGLFDLYIEASDTPYDVAGDGLIDGSGGRTSIYGSFMPGFTGQYEGDWITRPSTILINSAQLAGTADNSPSFILKYENAAVDSFYVLDNVRVAVTNDNIWETALWIDSSAKPTISESTFLSADGSPAVSTAVTITNDAEP